jgi:Tat protein translocase TatB subunit
MGIGISELLLIMIVALLVLGPEKMPVYAKKAGKALNSLKSYAGKLTEDINENIMEPIAEVQKPLRNMVEPLTNIAKDISKPIEDITSSIHDIGKVNNKSNGDDYSPVSDMVVTKAEAIEEEKSL